MRDKAFNEAEVTIFFKKVKYRDSTGAEKEAFNFSKLASVKFAEDGEEGGFLTPLTITWEGSVGAETDGSGVSTVKFLLEPANPESEELHSLGFI